MTMPDLPEVRASDAERAAALDLLRAHCEAGRLTLDEFGERSATALAARTRGELDVLLRDLPPIRHPGPPAPAPRPRSRAQREFVGHLTVYIVVNVFLIILW